MRLVACSVLVCAVAAFGALPVSAEEPKTPEIVATLFPATGLIPLGSERHIYRFQISATDPDDPHRSRASAETLVEPGQTRELSSGREREWEIIGTVTLKENGHVVYHATLLHNGQRVTSSSAGIKLTERD